MVDHDARRVVGQCATIGTSRAILRDQIGVPCVIMLTQGRPFAPFNLWRDTALVGRGHRPRVIRGCVRVTGEQLSDAARGLVTLTAMRHAPAICTIVLVGHQCSITFNSCLTDGIKNVLTMLFDRRNHVEILTHQAINPSTEPLFWH